MRLLAMQTAAPGGGGKKEKAFTPQRRDLLDLRLGPDDVAKVGNSMLADGRMMDGGLEIAGHTTDCARLTS